jgi:hypothetical protein
VLGASCAALLLASCGGGGGSGSPTLIEGTAAADKAISGGSIALQCVSGTVAGATTGSDGRYKLDISSVTLPCLLTVSGGQVGGAASTWTLASAVTQPGSIVNATPWTHMVVARTLGSADPAAVGITQAEPKLSDSSLDNAKALVHQELARLFGASPPSDLDAIATAFEAKTGNGMYDLLVQIVKGLKWTGKSLEQASAEIVAGQLQVTEVPGTCVPAVFTGFTGKFDDVMVQMPYDPSFSGGGGGGGGGGDGGGGGAGGAGGGALGQFLDAIVRVERTDGSLLGQNVTDAEKGLVTIVPCRYSGPLRITVRGKDDGSSQYYEESLRAYAPFPPGIEMNAVVPSLTKNVGITILTEGAWQYLKVKYGPDGWKNPAYIAEANEAVRKEFNRFLPAGLQVTDITRLPVLLNDRTGTASIEATPNGKYGVVNSGLARAGGLMLHEDVLNREGKAVLKLAQQMGADLCDGVIDGFCQDTPVFADSKDAAYLTQQLGEFLNAGVGDIATSCGNADIEQSSLRIVQVKVDVPGTPFSGGYEYREDTPIYFLRNDGKVFLWPSRSQASEPYRHDLTFAQLYPASRLLGRLLDGRSISLAGEISTGAGPTFVAGLDSSGSSAYATIARLPDGRVLTSNDPGTLGINVPGLRDVVRVAVARGGAGAPGYFALTTDGSLYAWGDNAAGQLGLGKTYDELNSQATPAIVSFPLKPGTGKPPTIVSVTGRMFGAFAIDSDGGVWGWGDPGSSQAHADDWTASTSPQLLASFDHFRSVRQIECAAYAVCIALSDKGEIHVWGDVKAMPLDERKTVFTGAAGLVAYGLLDNGGVQIFPARAYGSPFGQPDPLLVLPSTMPPTSGGNCTGSR